MLMPKRTKFRKQQRGRMAGNADVNSIMVSARDGVSTEKVQADIERLMRERRKLCIERRVMCAALAGCACSVFLQDDEDRRVS